MSMPSAHDVAREVRARQPDAGRWKMHKLLYYAQAWYVAWRGTPMYADAIEAWRDGPVVASFWRDEQHRAGQAPEPVALDPDRAQVLEFVLEQYGHLTGAALRDLTHLEAPWADAWADPWRKEISIDALAAFFRAQQPYLDREMRAVASRRDLFAPIDDPELDAMIDRARRGEKVVATRPR